MFFSRFPPYSPPSGEQIGSRPIDIRQHNRPASSDGIEERRKASSHGLRGGEQIKAKRASKGGREAVERNDQPGSVEWTGIAS